MLSLVRLCSVQLVHVRTPQVLTPVYVCAHYANRNQKLNAKQMCAHFLRPNEDYCTDYRRPNRNGRREERARAIARWLTTCPLRSASLTRADAPCDLATLLERPRTTDHAPRALFVLSTHTHTARIDFCLAALLIRLHTSLHLEPRTQRSGPTRRPFRVCRRVYSGRDKSVPVTCSTPFGGVKQYKNITPYGVAPPVVPHMHTQTNAHTSCMCVRSSWCKHTH